MNGTVVRYGHVPSHSDIQGFVEDWLRNYGNQSTNALSLSDWLEDRDDPRSEIAKRSGNARDLWKIVNPDDRRLYVKSHLDYIPLTPEDAVPRGLPRQKLRVHVYGFMTGKDKPLSPNRRLEEIRRTTATPMFVRLAFGVRSSKNGGEAEYGGYFSRKEAEDLLDQFHPDAAAAAKRAIAEGFAGQ